jgi:hypothetical protein
MKYLDYQGTGWIHGSNRYQPTEYSDSGQDRRLEVNLGACKMERVRLNLEQIFDKADLHVINILNTRLMNDQGERTNLEDLSS